jgi:magnesium transporter
VINSIAYLPGQAPLTDIPVDEYEKILTLPESLLWVDFVSEPDESCEPIMSGIFHFHPLAVDDALKETHIPKIDDWNDYLYIVMNSIDPRGIHSLIAQTMELDVFIGKNYIVTHHDKPFPAVEKTLQTSRLDPRFVRSGPAFLLYKLVDDLVAEYWPIVEKIDAEIDIIEDRVFNDPAPELLEQLFSVKRMLLAMRRILGPQREVLNRLARDKFAVLGRKDRVLFRDIYDHVVRLHELNESLRDLVGGTMDSYLSVINNRMNEIMKTLTVITTIFIPITFVTGFFGMNFFEPVAQLTRWTDWGAFLIAVAILILLPFSMYAWMRRRTWV